MFLGNVADYQTIRCHNPQSYNIHFRPFESTESIRMHKSQRAESLWFCRNVTKQFSRLLIHEPPGGVCQKQYVVMKQPKGTYASVDSVAWTLATKLFLDSRTTDSGKHIPNPCVRADNYCFIAYNYIVFILMCRYVSDISDLLQYRTYT
jgi:hypothetical protein